MKKLLLIATLFSGTICNAQFWTENFNTVGCSNGNLADGYVSSNGTWSVTSTGTNDTYADVWYVSSRGNNTGAGNCATGCLPPLNSTLHVGNADLSAFGVGPDSAITYLTGALCSSFSICSTTHKRVWSPTINCTGQNGISVSMIYIENGEAADDDARMVYSPDGGTTWSLLDTLPKTVVCGSSGIWTSHSVMLPPSANNNPTVKIGFNWSNDNDGAGNDPSFAVDDIMLSGTVGINTINAQEDCNVYCDGNTIIVRSQSAFKVLSVMNLLGKNVSYTLNGNAIQLKENTEGIYFIRIETAKQVVTRKVHVLR